MTNSSSGDLYLDTIYLRAVNRNGNKQWNIEVLVKRPPVTFKVDRGAEITALLYITFNLIQKSMPQLKSQTRLYMGQTIYHLMS